MKTFKLLASLFLVIFLTSCSNQENKNPLLSDDEVDALIKDPEYLTDYRKAMEEAIEEEKVNKDYKLVRELEDLEDDKKAGNKVKGSCDMVSENSTCIEYYGSFWTELIMREGCEEGVGVFSTKPCPTGMSGGCNTGVGTMADMVSWMYSTGGGGITQESLKYAKLACDATMASRWIVTK
jgi:hypothetical protein